ncbi:tripartite ATP-independent transporter DctM subunit [Aquamicrobium lusatiense]|uniref:TRAP transporter large permease protein n=1 Tax=Aquamicrobium lusatiense TaxID=89772 RepID=A0A7W9VWW3_9HYPH|nr:TRAP transporter large permease [Aquamicrobium lusatiense]MBB6014568.1 tripartite ATP-independent transporter DctM subunit [Aquamicrobium lusatiense]
MSPETIGLLGVAALFLMILTHVPIGIAMGVSGVLTFGLLRNWSAAFAIVGTEASTVFASLELAIIPLFLIMGSFAASGGMGRDIYRLAYAFLGHYRGGLAMATIGGCAGFGAVCGSSIATVSTMTQVSYGEMRQRGYAPTLSTGSIAAGGTLGILVPPSVIIVLYAVLSEQFILTLFTAALVPAVLAVVGYMLSIWVVVSLNPDAGPAGEKSSWRERAQAVRESWATILLAAVVAGGIYSGLFTVTESASIGAILAVVIAVVRGKTSWAVFWHNLYSTAATSAMLYVILIGASVFSYALTLSRLPSNMVAIVGNLDVPPLMIVAGLMVIYIILGALFDTVSAMVLTMPFVYPLILNMGMDPIWWGIVMVMVIEIGMVTPPIGINALIMKSMLPQSSLRDIYVGIVPFLVSDLIRLTLVILFPALVLWLPTLLDLPR